MAIKFSKKLKNLGVCQEAIEWVGDRTEQEAWEECKRPDWMLWYVFRAKIGTKKDRILAVCACARMALKYVPEGEERPRLAIEAAERYAQEPTKENRAVVKEAAKSAIEAAKEAIGTAAWSSAWAAREAAWSIIVKANWEASFEARESVRLALEAVRSAAWVEAMKLNRGESERAWEEAEEAKKASCREMCRIIREKIKLK